MPQSLCGSSVDGSAADLTSRLRNSAVQGARKGGCMLTVGRLGHEHTACSVRGRWEGRGMGQASHLSEPGVSSKVCIAFLPLYNPTLA